MKSSRTEPTSILPFPVTDGRDELNLAEFPVSLLSERVPAGVKTLEFQDVIVDPQTNQPVTRKLIVTAADKFGLPTAKDDEVLLGLIHLTRRANNFTERKVHFSRYELVQLLGWPDTGQSYRRVEESLDRWCGVYLVYERAWWDHQSKGWVNEKFHVLDRVSLFDAKERGQQQARQGYLPFSHFTWSEVLFRSMQAGYLKRLNLEFYLTLTSATAKRLYRFLDKRFYHSPRWEFDLHELAAEHIGLSRGYHTGVLKQKLAPAIAELERRGVIEPLPAAERYRKLPGRGGWRVVFVRKVLSESKAASSPAAAGLAKLLTARGVTAKVAAELVADHPADRIAHHLDVFDWLTADRPEHLGKNPAGYLVQSIRDDYAPPAGYEPKGDRERKKQAAATAAATRAQAAAAKRQQEQAEKAAEECRRAHVDGYLAGLAAGERQALEERAVAAGEEWQQRCVRLKQPGAAMLRRLLVEQEVLRAHPLLAGPAGQPGG